MMDVLLTLHEEDPTTGSTLRLTPAAGPHELWLSVTDDLLGEAVFFLTDEQAEQLERVLYLHRINRAFPERPDNEEENT